MMLNGCVVVPLAADGKIAIGHPTVGVRVRKLETDVSHTIMDKTGQTPFYLMLDEAMEVVLKQHDEIVAARNHTKRLREGAEMSVTNGK